MKKLLIIMNPCSGKKKANSQLTDIIDVFNRADFEVSVHMTAERGDAALVASQRAQNYDILVCIGGDGTLNEIVTGLCQSGLDTPVGYIPAGSTNDFASSLHLSKDPVQAARDITTGVPHSFDLGRFNDRYFSYIASFGAFTRASYATPQSLKNLLGHTAYILSGVKELASIRSHRVRFTTADGTVYEDNYIFCAVSNSTSVAGILTLDPKRVDMNDGLFELLLVRKPKSLLELGDCVLALTSQDYSSPMLTFISTPSLVVETEAEFDWTLDGEYCKGAPLCNISNLHSVVQLIFPS
ncbi:MAG: YegS/Rv2252/BmrU family lipid kinase [Oscillospiraceae bacterium]|nr:YegS/Rv2252/BmrU family lipid kinase [Oscillospiraceae bacterium]